MSAPPEPAGARPPDARAFHDTWASIGGGVTLAAAIAGAAAIPSVHRALGVGRFDVAGAMLVVIVLLLAVRLVPTDRGSRTFLIRDAIETVVTFGSVLYLVVASGRGDSFFWLMALAHVAATLPSPQPGFDRVVFVGGGLAVVAWFGAVRGEGTGAALALVATGLMAFIHWFGTQVGERLAAHDRERAALAAELAEVRVREERGRIARDLHDGVATDLAALTWRLRQLGGAGSGNLDDELAALDQRLRHASDDLRAIVWAVRSPGRTWRDLVEHVEVRARELAGARTVTVTATGDQDLALPGDVALALVRGALELVHNAARHADAGVIAVALDAGAARWSVAVTDDGHGGALDAADATEGGLANLRRRAADLGGAVTVTRPAAGGSAITLTVPRGA